MGDTASARIVRCLACGMSQPLESEGQNSTACKICGNPLQPPPRADDELLATVDSGIVRRPDLVCPVDFDESFLAEYEIERFLGQGAFGAVFQARQRALDRVVAVKFTTVPDKQALARFLLEGQVLAQLRHENIMGIFASGECGQKPFLVFEYLEGQTLKDRIAANSPMRWNEAADLAHKLLDGLAYAHAKGIIHRDLKSENVILPASGGLKIADFGLAKAEFAASGASRTGIVVGTPAYMAPEQAQGHPVDARADLYAAGVILFEMLTGQLPFLAPSAIEVLTVKLSKDPPTVRSLNPQISVALDEVVFRALARDPAERFASARQFSDGLREAIRKAPGRRTTQPVPTLVSARQSGRITRRVVSAAPQTGSSGWKWGVALVALVALVGVGLGFRSGPAPVSTATPAPIPTTVRSVDQASPRPEVVTTADGSQMRLVKGGLFTMGTNSTDRDFRDARPEHRPYVSDFYIDATEVSNAQYIRYLTRASKEAAKKHRPGPPEPRWLRDPDFKAQDQPVVGVTWAEASDYCACYGKRLPREAEWERAARGPKGRVFPWVHGNHIGEGRANFGDLANLRWKEKRGRKPDKVDEYLGDADKLAHTNIARFWEETENDGYPTTAPVTTFGPGASPEQVMNLVGNVSEWCHDIYDPAGYPGRDRVSPRDPTGPTQDQVKGRIERVVRGGSWAQSSRSRLTSIYRESVPPEGRSDQIGFRCAQTADVLLRSLSRSGEN